MTIDDIYKELQDIMNSGDPTFSQAAQLVGQVTQQAHSGQISVSELQETLADVQRQISIIQDMSEMAYKEKLNTIINGIITIAGAV
jgi:septation ring formation regulator EzrA